jgi:hypothetical protein
MDLLPGSCCVFHLCFVGSSLTRLIYLRYGGFEADVTSQNNTYST